MRILFITPYVPSLIRVRPYNLIKHLAKRGHRINLISLYSSACERRDAETAKSYCERIEIVFFPKQRSFLNCFKALPTFVPLQAAYCFSSEMGRAIKRALDTEPFDIVHVEHLRAAHFGLDISYPRIWDAIDSISLLSKQAAKNNPSALIKLLAKFELARTRRYEAAMLQQYDRTIVTSPIDREALRELGPNAQIMVVPNGVDLEYFTPRDQPREPDSIIMTGKMSYHANVAAALYFCQEILPRIWLYKPHTKVYIVGNNPPKSIKKLACDKRIIVTGFVSDMRSYLARAVVSVAPIVYGVGIQNKVLEAMAMGIPVVATSQACAALEVTNGQDVFIADEPSQFAQQVLKLLETPELRKRIGSNGRRFVEENHDWRLIVQSLEEIYEEVIEEGGSYG